MGDSLKNARIFVNSCDLALSAIAEAPRDTAIEALSTIQSGAKLNYARAIYRAAQDTLNALSKGQDAPNRLATLTELVKQYEQGLVELEPQSNETDTTETALTSVSDEEDKTPITHTPDTTSESDIVVAAAPVQMSEKALQERAIDTLSDTLYLARAEEKPPLESIRKIARDMQKDATYDVLNNAEVTSKIALETLIQDVVQQGLSYARQSDLTLSFSYDMGAVTLPFDKAFIMKRRMERWVGHLVSHLIAQNDPNGLAHIDLSATAASIRIATTAPALPEAVLSTSPDKAYIRQEVQSETQSLALYLSLSEDGTTRAKPRKVPVEEGIASRLDALLSENTPQETVALQTNVLDFDEAAAKRRASS